MEGHRISTSSKRKREECQGEPTNEIEDESDQQLQNRQKLEVINHKIYSSKEVHIYLTEKVLKDLKARGIIAKSFERTHGFWVLELAGTDDKALLFEKRKYR
eukprot:918200_1